MSPKPQENLSAAEWKVMKIIWQKGSCAARDVCRDAAEQYGWAASTVKTLLRRLVEKGYLKTTAIGNSFLYQPVHTAVHSLYRAADTLLDNALEGAVGPLLMYMARKGNLSSEELAELRSLFDRLASEQEQEP